MTFEINHADNHLQLFFTTHAVTAEDVEQAVQSITDSLDDIPYLIVDFEEVTLLEQAAKDALNQLGARLDDRGGLLLLSNADPTLHKGLNAEPIHSLQEAVDMMFMYQLEKELDDEQF